MKIKLGYILQYNKTKNKNYYMTQENEKWFITEYSIEAKLFKTKAEAEKIAKELRKNLVLNHTIKVVDFVVERI